MWLLGSARLSPASLASSLFSTPNRWWVITYSWFIIQTVVVLLQNKHFHWPCPNAKTVSQPPLILGFNCFALLSTDVPLPHAWSPFPTPPPSCYGFFSCSHTANVMSNSCNITGPFLKQREEKKSQTPPCLLLELSRLFSRGCVNPHTMKGNSYVNQTGAPCSPPSPTSSPIWNNCFLPVEMTNDWLPSAWISAGFFPFAALDSRVASCFFLFMHLVVNKKKKKNLFKKNVCVNVILSTWLCFCSLGSCHAFLWNFFQQDAQNKPKHF